MAINLVFSTPGTFTARLTSVSMLHLKLFSVQESLPRIAYVSLPAKSINLAFANAFPAVPDLERGRDEITGSDVPQRR